MIEKAELLLEGSESYVPSTLAGLEAVLESAKQVYADKKAAQSTIDEATHALTREAAKARLMGDVDGNGMVDTGDGAKVLMAAAELSGLSEEQKLCGDVNGDGTVDTSDAALILKYASEMVNTL